MNKKFIIAGLCSVGLVLFLVVIAAAQALSPESGINPAANAPAGTGDWRQANENGFGNPATTWVPSLEAFKGYLYAGTGNWVEGGQVWRTTDGSSWEPVSEPGFGSAYTITNAALIDMIEFKGQLYVSTGWRFVAGQSAPGQIWRSPNGTDWTQVEDAGFDDPDNLAIAAFGVFSNTLYVTTHSNNGVEIWRSGTGDSGDWARVVAHGNGNANNSLGTSLMEFKGFFYAAVNNETDGAEIWRTDNGATWTPVSSGGFDSPLNIETGGFAIHDENLYIGTRNDTTGGQIWYSNSGTDWTQRVGDGFGDINNIRIDSLISYHGVLNAGATNIVTGIEMWRPAYYTTWTQVNLDGFGDSSNVGYGLVGWNGHLQR